MKHISISSVKNLFFQSAHILKNLVGFGSVIIIHALGQLLACKLFGVSIVTFSVGFGPVLGRLIVGDTVFNLCLVPIGGLIVIDPVDFALQSCVSQITILLAGIGANLCFALGIYWYRGGSGADLRHTLSLFNPLKIYAFIIDIGKQLCHPFDWMHRIMHPMHLSWDSLATMSVGVGMFNILPFSFCDGGKIIRVFVSRYYEITPPIDMSITVGILICIGILILLMRKKNLGAFMVLMGVCSLSGMEIAQKEVSITKVYEHSITSGTHIILDVTPYPKKIEIFSSPIAQQKPFLFPEALLKNTVYQTINKNIYYFCYGVASKIITIKNAYQRSIKLRALYSQDISNTCRPIVLKDEPFSITYSQGGATITIKPTFEIPDRYEFEVPSDSPLTVTSTKNIILHTALGDITRQEKGFNHPRYEKEELVINNIPYAYYSIPKISLTSTEGTVVVKECEIKN